VWSGGGISGLPAIHGMADDRLRVQLDGMNLISACPNHMNSPLSYIDPSQVGLMRVYSGIAPVSVSGDSIGATIQVESAAPVFAQEGQDMLTQGSIGAYYRSNNNAVGGSLAATMATHNFSLSYQGSTAQADNYTAASNFKAAGTSGGTTWLAGNEVGSTSYKTQNNLFSMALQNDSGTQLVELGVGIQRVPYENYPNQRMDMTSNDSTIFNLHYKGLYDWGSLDARVYHQTVQHEMNFGEDKVFWYGNAPGMPMYTDGKDTGASVVASLNVGTDDTLKLGLELQGYNLNDWWPPSGTGMMSPSTFWNINDGNRNRFDLFAEWEKRWSPAWQSIIGLRSDNVSMSAGDVQGYSTQKGVTSYMMTAANAAAFNASDRDKTDHNIDASALARYTPDATQNYEFGLARQVRSPNLYERYSWSTWSMAAVMNNYVGDGNGYVGDINLKPEQASTLSATANWHDASGKQWDVRLTPYYSYVQDYIDAQCAPGATCKANQFNVLQYVNQNAQIYGVDLSGQYLLAQTEDYGNFTTTGTLSYTHGRNEATGEGLYNIVPLQARLALIQNIGTWANTVEAVLVDSKTNVSSVRGEQPTSGYGLVNLRTSYTWHKLRIDLGIENLFDQFYDLPQGGAYLGQGKTMSINGVPFGVPVPGMGRSLYASLNYSF
jgi:iron complex outermembrane receptor protein